MVETKAVSVRLPLDLLNELNTYATDKGMVRGGDANIGGAIIAILRERFFNESDNVKQVSDNVDIQAMIDDALRSKILELREEFEEHEEIYKSQCQKGFELQISTFRDEMHEAIATAKKPLLSVMREKVLAA